MFHNSSNNEQKEPLTIAQQLNSKDYKDIRILLLLDSGQVPGISVQHESVSQAYKHTETPSSPPGNRLVQAIVQAFSQLGLALPFGQTGTPATGEAQGISSTSHAGSLSGAGVDAIFEQFIGQILQVAPGLQYGTASSPASQGNSGNQGNGPSATTAYSNPLAEGLESLARAVGAGSIQTGEASGNSETGSTTSLNNAVSKLQQDFNTLFGSTGADNRASLKTFLQTFASNVTELWASRSGGTFVLTSA
ncbi:hypothetical protein VSR68_29605 [Paraburkholderia phymatum]|uniref:hypothetical protein n=1 Tax=Paraburkholderia phymatum TaxID=148447 RepID=UPI003171D507